MKLLKLLHIVLVLFVFSPGVCGQVFPADNDSLHYRLIGFRFDEHHRATRYVLEVFDGVQSNTAAQGKPLLTIESATNKAIATLPEFGRYYTWRIKYYRKQKLLNTGDSHRFYIKPTPFSGGKTSRVVVIDSAKKYKDMLLFFDHTRSIHNMAGEPLWFLPSIPGITDTSFGVMRDIKLTGDGTITILTTKNIHEIDYNANVLWSGPNDGKHSGNDEELYHHEFTKLANGNYMVLGNKYVEWDKQYNRSRGITSENKVICGTVIEYNPRKEIVWSWNSCDHLQNKNFLTHMNSFYYDSVNNFIYTSFRDNSRVLKAKYPSGEVVERYGESNRKGMITKGDSLFYAQHNVRINKDGDMYLFNNNYIMHYPESQHNDSRISTIAIFKEPAKPEDPLKTIWEYKCDIDTFADHVTPGGGSVEELNDDDYLVCMGRAGRVFIVSNDKKILWNVITQKHGDNGWENIQNYRVSTIKQEDLESLLFYVK